MWRAAGDTIAIFPGAPSEWSADQRRLIDIQKEYSNALSIVSIRDHEPPDEDILQNYRKFREWFKAYQEDPTIGENPYKKYNHGFSVK